MDDLRWMWESIKAWGPGMFIGLAVLYAGYKLLFNLGKYAIRKIGEALEKPAEALSSQARSMDRLTMSIKDYVGRDTNEHQEIIILQKVIRHELRETRGNLEDLKEQSNRIEKYFEEKLDGRS